MGRGRRFFPDGTSPTKLRHVESKALGFGSLAHAYQPAATNNRLGVAQRILRREVRATFVQGGEPQRCSLCSRARTFTKQACVCRIRFRVALRMVALSPRRCLPFAGPDVRQVLGRRLVRATPSAQSPRHNGGRLSDQTSQQAGRRPTRRNFDAHRRVKRINWSPQPRVGRQANTTTPPHSVEQKIA